MLILTLALTLVSSSCVPKRTNTSNPSNSTADSDRIAALESKVGQLQSKIASLPAASQSQDYSNAINKLQGDIDGLYDALDDFQAQVDDAIAGVDVTLADWEEQWEEKQVVAEEIAQEDNFTRWSLEAYTNYTDEEVNVGIYTSPSRIDEVGTYKIKLTVSNYMPTAITNLYVSLDMMPKTGDIVFIDDKNTYLDTTRSPYYLWDVDVATRGTDKHTTRISFTSDSITVPAATSSIEPIVPSETILILELDLEYK